MRKGTIKKSKFITLSLLNSTLNNSTIISILSYKWLRLTDVTMKINIITFPSYKHFHMLNNSQKKKKKNTKSIFVVPILIIFKKKNNKNEKKDFIIKLWHTSFPGYSRRKIKKERRTIRPHHKLHRSTAIMLVSFTLDRDSIIPW